MELVYLWVEDYKNIKKQGFNFSPRFKCHYDENTNELTINENREYVSIFPENINVTAIVGENGSGKSSLIKFIFKGINPNTISYDNRQMLACWLNNEKNCMYIHTYINELTKDKIFSNFEYKIEKTQSSFYKYKEGYEKEKFESFFYLYSNNLEQEYDILDGYELNDLYIKYSEFNKHNDTINLNEINNKLNKYMLHYLLDKANLINNEVKSFFIPEKIEIKKTPYKFLTDDDNEAYINFKTSNPNKYKQLLKLENILYLKNQFQEQNMQFINANFKDMKQFIDNNLSYDLNRIDELFEQLSTYHLATILQSIDGSREEIISNHNIGNDDLSVLLNEIEKTINFHLNIDKLLEYSSSCDDYIYEINQNLLTFDLVDYLLNLPAYLEIDFYQHRENNLIALSELSSGEQNLLRVLYSVKNIIRIKKNTHSFNIFLDEIENTLHPNWQKKLINWLVDAIKDYKNQINLFVSSHSPFLLSDIPKENVIFLEKGKQVYPFDDGYNPPTKKLKNF